MIPRLGRNIPHSYGDHTGSAKIVRDLVAAKLLSESDAANNIDELITLGLYRIDGLAKFEDMGSCNVEGGEFNFALYAPDYTVGHRLYLAPLFAEVAGRASLELLDWMVSVLNKHALITGPERFSGVLDYFDELQGQTLTKDEAVAQFAPEWLSTEKTPSRANELRCLCPELAAPFIELASVDANVLAKYADDRGWCVTAWTKGCPIDHCWDYEMEEESNGNLGTESFEAFVFTCTSIPEIRAAFDYIGRVLQPIEQLIQWTSRHPTPASPLQLRSSFTTATENQLSLAIP